MLQSKLIKTLIKLSTIGVRNKAKRKALKDKLFYKYVKEYQYSFNHKTLGKIYLPRYHPSYILPSTQPDIYNSDGQKLESFFLRDSIDNYCGFNTPSKYFIFDRYNYSLDTHFYAHEAMFETMGNPIKKYGLLIESEVIRPLDYEFLLKNKAAYEEFDAIFTFSDRVLNSCSNAVLAPLAATVWYGNPMYGGIFDENLYQNKSKEISIIASNLNVCPMHLLRQDVAIKCKQINNVDTYGAFDGGAYFDDISIPFADYRYSIAIENDITPYYFTEKILNCFASQTVPIYFGATKISDYFNPDGIISLNIGDLDNLDSVLKQCSKKDYLERLPAILDNYQRVFKYINVFDNIYNNHLKEK